MCSDQQAYIHTHARYLGSSCVGHAVCTDGVMRVRILGPKAKRATWEHRMQSVMEDQACFAALRHVQGLYLQNDPTYRQDENWALIYGNIL